MLDILRRFGLGIRLVIAVVIVVPCGIMMAIFAAVQFIQGSGTLHVVPSPNETVSISIDNGPAEVAMPFQHWRRDLPQGMHHVVVTGPLGITQMDVNVSNGFWSNVVPTSPSQCWVELDATHYYFGTSRTMPTILNRYQANEPISVGSDYLAENELPSSIDENATLRMLVPASCGILAQPDAAIVSMLGYQ
jgi:hypothetical protein